MNRRLALKILGVGTAFFGFARNGWAANEATNAVSNRAVPQAHTQPFILPLLPFAYDALEPHFDARTMEIHHTKHHQAYINAANKALEARPDLRELTGEQLMSRLDAFDEPLLSTLRNQLGGHLNHAFFWTLLAPPAEYRSGPLRAEIIRTFGSLDAFKKEFTQAATSRFGSGWAWLVWQNGSLRVISTSNQESPLSQGQQPIIGLDVWEHAYYLAYQNRRADYVQAFWSVLNWDVAEAAYAAIAPL